ncbi:MAG: ETC complex I subunit [Pseudomonadota bacterium]
MVARIFKPSRTAMQSGRAKSAAWVLEFDAQTARTIDPLMGWTSASDTRPGQVRLTFETKDEAVAYATGHGIAYQVIKARTAKPVIKAYADNFSANRRKPWTH